MYYIIILFADIINNINCDYNKQNIIVVSEVTLECGRKYVCL